ncbi:MAG: hypothetical protein U0X20_03000 [Caldilineaceae bacterium]
MRQSLELPKILSGYGQLFHDDRSPIDVRYQIVLPAPAVVRAQPVHAARAAVPAAAPTLPPVPATASGSLVILNRAELWRIDLTAEYYLALANGKRCRVSLHHDAHQPFTKYRIVCSAQDLR